MQGLREMVRVTRPGGTVSAIACFCHSGNHPQYHGRSPVSDNNRLDQLNLKLDRVFRLTVRPRVLGVDHTILNLDLLWQFKSVGLQEVQINGHLVLVSPGDARISAEQGTAYALAQHRQDIERLRRLRQEHGPALAEDGFSPAEFDDLIALKQAQYEYLQGNPTRVREVMEVFTISLMIIRGTRLSS